MTTTMGEFLDKLRATDEGTKTKLIIVATIIIMAIIIYVWLAYFSPLLALVHDSPATDAQQNDASTPTAIAPSSPSPSILERMGSVYHMFADKIGALGNILNAPREYVIKPN